jgi:hypothetical protein
MQRGIFPTLVFVVMVVILNTRSVKADNDCRAQALAEARESDRQALLSYLGMVEAEKNARTAEQEAHKTDQHIKKLEKERWPFFESTRMEQIKQFRDILTSLRTSVARFHYTAQMQRTNQANHTAQAQRWRDIAALCGK